MADALRLNDSMKFSQLARENKFFRPLIKSGFDLVKSGVTTLSEVIRIIGANLED